MGTTKWNASDVIEAIQGTGGVKTRIAQKLNVTRQTIDNYLERWVTVREAYEEEKARIDDIARNVIIKSLKAEDLSTAKWWATMKMADEFSNKTRQEITGAEGGPVVVVNWDGAEDTD